MKNKFFIFILSFVFCFIGCEKIESSQQEIPQPSLPQKQKKVLMVFSADWCKYCQYLKKDLPKFDLKDYEVKIINFDKRKDLVKKYNIHSLPTSIIIFENQEKSRMEGYQKNKYLKWINN